MILFSLDLGCMIRALSYIKHGKEHMMSGKALRLIQLVSKRDQVMASFNEAILSGTIQPGEAIIESKIAQRLASESRCQASLK
jgi:hypothetical protein